MRDRRLRALRLPPATLFRASGATARLDSTNPLGKGDWAEPGAGCEARLRAPSRLKNHAPTRKSRPRAFNYTAQPP